MNCEVVKIETPDKLILNGLWFGENKSKRVLVFLHGLTSSPFSHHELLTPLVDKDTAVLFLGNRGMGVISRFSKINKKKKKGTTSEFIGMAHEVFADCIHDIQGVVNFLHKKGISDITLVGHSTGCQKAVYYLSRPGKQKLIKRVVLLSPLSDFAYAQKFEDPEKLKKTTEYALKRVADSKPHELLPPDISSEVLDAQRFLSLYTPDSIENQIFPYYNKENNPKILKSIKIPTLIVLGEKDEFRDRPAKRIAKWFEKMGKKKEFTVTTMPNALHSFNFQEEVVVNKIREWMK